MVFGRGAPYGTSKRKTADLGRFPASAFLFSLLLMMALLWYRQGWMQP
jgi:hypothetical protein